MDDKFLVHFVASIIYVFVGLVFFALAFFLICKFTPFSVRKEIEEDQNTSLAVLIGSVIIGIAIIVAAAIHGS
jgi:putative membrane protein